MVVPAPVTRRKIKHDYPRTYRVLGQHQVNEKHHRIMARVAASDFEHMYGAWGK